MHIPFSYEGYEVHGASSGEEALTMLTECLYEGVIVDMRRPGIDGNEVIQKARKSGCEIPFLIHTGSTDFQLPNSLKYFGFSHEDIILKFLPNLTILSQALQKKLENY